MLQEFRFPIGFEFPDGQKYKKVVHSEVNFQIVETENGTRYLVATEYLSDIWLERGLIGVHSLSNFSFGEKLFRLISAGVDYRMSLVSDAESSFSKVDALAFALALKETRGVDKDVPLQDAIYVEKLSRLLPTFSLTTAVSDDILLGTWLTGGVNVSVHSIRRLKQLVGIRYTASELGEILRVGGFETNKNQIEEQSKVSPANQRNQKLDDKKSDARERQDETECKQEFKLSGRPELTKFFNEHVVDVVRNRTQYKQLGIEFPSAIVLYGPPGTGKTYAANQLAEFLGWPIFNIEASSIGSPYIHETGRKISQVFDSAIENSPCVMIIDEMEAFLASREMNAGHHRVEELAEFLRRIPEAVSSDVLIISMTNRIDMVDEAILRRGRFDHLIEVGYANQEEVKELLDSRLSKIPSSDDIDTTAIASILSERPMSDIDFVLREAARLAVRANKDVIDHESITLAIDGLKRISQSNDSERKIGFF